MKLLTDSPGIAHALVEFGRQHGHWFDLLIEIDSDGHRAGVKPQDPLLLEIAALLGRDDEAGDSQAGDGEANDSGAENPAPRDGGARLAGVMTHAGASYELDTQEALVTMAEQERSRCVEAAQRLRAAGHACPIVSVGSTPTALSALSLDGVTEVRAGVYVTLLRILPNHACATAAQFGEYHLAEASGEIAVWPRFSGWA